MVVEIGDTGPGMPPQVAARAFEAFYTTKEVGKGAGLGLDIAQRISRGATRRHHHHRLPARRTRCCGSASRSGRPAHTASRELTRSRSKPGRVHERFAGRTPPARNCHQVNLGSVPPEQKGSQVSRSQSSGRITPDSGSRRLDRTPADARTGRRAGSNGLLFAIDQESQISIQRATRPACIITHRPLPRERVQRDRQGRSGLCGDQPADTGWAIWA